MKLSDVLQWVEQKLQQPFEPNNLFIVCIEAAIEENPYYTASQCLERAGKLYQLNLQLAVQGSGVHFRGVRLSDYSPGKEYLLARIGELMNLCL
jgi:hypothetical protein